MNVERVQKHNGGAPIADESLAAEDCLSALMDSELGDQGVDAALARCVADADWSASLSAYRVIGDVLRGSRDVLPRQAPSAFLHAVKAGLDAPATVSSTQMSQMSQVAQVAQEVVVPEPVVDGARAVRTVRGEAANAPVLRWKLAAGVASVAAVMAVSWGMLQRGAPDAIGSGAPQLSQSGPATPAALGGAQAVASSASEGTSANPAMVGVPVVVMTGQGQLIRDARLEQLLAEHRQYGGMSALQMPAGFLRNATYDAAPGR